MKRHLFVGLGLFLLVPLAAAHDMWLVPPAGESAVGSAVEVVVAVGMDFPISTNAIGPERLTVRVVGPTGESVPPAVSKDEEHARTLVRFEPSTPGTWLVGVSTLPNKLELEAAMFNDYLLHDGMPHVLAGRMDRGELDRPAVERYSKHVKTLVPVGESRGGTSASVALGLELEIVLHSDPLRVGPGSTLTAQVLFHGEPLQHANLCWDHPGNGEDFTGQTWTNAEGKALVPVDRAGPMTLRLVHMTRPETPEYEWESFWSSFTFHVRSEDE